MLLLKYECEICGLVIDETRLGLILTVRGIVACCPRCKFIIRNKKKKKEIKIQ